ncbi:MAG: M16 family metallopeptidase [Chloroflexota bacterium]
MLDVPDAGSGKIGSVAPARRTPDRAGAERARLRIAPVSSSGSSPYGSEPGALISVLDNGLRIITRSRGETRAVALNLAVLAGSRDEDASAAGAAHVMEHLFFQGTETAPTPDDVVGPIVAKGGTFNASTEREMIGFFVDAPGTALTVALDRLSDVIVHARFDGSRLEKVRGVVIEELRRRANDASQLARDTFFDLVLAEHPARHSPGGTPENVRAIDLDALQRYRSERFRAGNMVLAVVGCLDHDSVVQQVQHGLGALPGGDSPRDLVAPPRSTGAQRELRAGRTTAQIVLGFCTPGLHSGERFRLAVTAAILGRAGRRLRRELREDRGLTYSVSAQYGALSDVGVFSIATAVDTDRCDEALDAIASELQRLRENGVSDAELAMAAGYIEGRTYLHEERNLAQARRISGQELLGAPQSLDDYVHQIQQVTTANVQDAAQEYLDATRAVRVVVRP